MGTLSARVDRETLGLAVQTLLALTAATVTLTTTQRTFQEPQTQVTVTARELLLVADTTSLKNGVRFRIAAAGDDFQLATFSLPVEALRLLVDAVPTLSSTVRVLIDAGAKEGEQVPAVIEFDEHSLTLFSPDTIEGT